MKQKLIDILESRGYKAYLQGSFLEDRDLPVAFWTFWNYDTSAKYYNNRPVSVMWDYWIYFYATDPETVETEVNETIKLLINNGIIIESFGEDANSGNQTHTGRMLTIHIPHSILEE